MATGTPPPLRWDADQGAVLLERLGRDLWAEAVLLAEQGRVVVPLLQDAWRVPLACGTPFRGKAAGLLGILAELGPRYGSDHPGAIPLATRYARQLASAERAEVVCHGDPHTGNVLRCGTGWALIDPDGFVDEVPTTSGSSCETPVASSRQRNSRNLVPLCLRYDASATTSRPWQMSTRSGCGSGRSSNASPPGST